MKIPPNSVLNDWEAFKEWLGYYEQETEIGKDMIRLDWEAIQLQNQGCTPNEWLQFKLTGMFALANKYNVGEDQLMKGIIRK